jgi:DNA polymerase-3 subunit delta'
MKFDAFVGNRRIIDRLRLKLREGRFPHGLIFSGPDGVGKHLCALMIAKALNCHNQPPGDFCDACASCRKIDAGTHPDVTTITVEEDASTIKIAQIRSILGTLDLRPLEGRSKVYIIDPANAMHQEASNALLKGLEEPPENSYFILISVNVHELLMTVRSRSQVYNFTPLTLEQIREHGISDDLVARWSRGSIGRAKSTDVVRLKSERERVLDFAEVALSAGPAEFQDLLGVSSDIGRAKQEFEERMAILAVVIADLIYTKEGIPENVVNIDLQDRLQTLAARTSIDRLLAVGEFLAFIETSLKSYLNRQMLTDVLALTANDTTSQWLGPVEKPPLPRP